MEILKPNDILIATLNSPQATPYDLLSNNITGENTSLFSKEEYKQSEYVQKAFQGADGKFDEISFNKAYDLAKNNFYQLTSEEYLQALDQIDYSPFDITRPKFAKTFSVTTSLEKEYNPFREKRGWTGIGSIDAGELSLRELAQQNKIYDPETGSWSDKSVNDLSILDKLFGDTLVYAQYDEDGEHFDYNSGLMVGHKKGDWKVNEDGNLFIERLAGREVYGKQVVNPMDTLTTDGSIVNKFDFLDSDGRTKSMAGTAFKIGLEIAPFLIPSFGVFKGIASIPSIYGGIKAAIGLTTVMPTLYKSFEGLLLGDNDTSLTQGATELEGWLSKYTQTSVSDEASQSLFSGEQMVNMVGDIFSQIYEQRAAASLAKLIYRGDKLMNEQTQKMAMGINQKLINEALEGKIDFNDIGDLSKAAMEKIPALKSVIEKQSQMSKALSLGYMALTSTSDIYGQAILGGYDRRTAGFAALAASAGQYGIMMNNRMGDWFLDKTTGYSTGTNRALMRKSVLPWLDEVEKGFKSVSQNSIEGKKQLAGTFTKIKNSIQDIFTTPSVIGEAMWKNALVEGAEEVTEQAVLDATKGIIDTLSALGLTKKEGSFGGWQNVFSKQGFENYLANFVGGILGGGMFEFHRAKIAPWLDPTMLAPETQKSLYELIAAGEKNEVINLINSRRASFGNKYITAINQDGSFQEVGENSISQADLIADKAIEMVNVIDGILNSHDLIHTDDEIINKAIMDKIIINDLKKTAPEGSTIGLEGLVLEDYKTKMARIVQTEAKIKSIEDKPENQKAIKSLKDSLKLYVQDVNDILEGKQGSKYFRQAMLYLNKDINSALLKISKNDFAKEKFNVNFNDLEETGLGITQEFINEEWNKYISSKDLRKDLDVADRVYVEIEKILNEPIAAYAESGYDIVRKESLKNILDLRTTIEMFNTSTNPEEKTKALERFIEINNMIDSKGTIAPWTVLHNDMYNQLSNLGLIKKVSYSKDAEGQTISTMSDFTPSELEESVNKTDVKRKDNMQNIIQKFFKQFSLNPLNAEQVIQQLNAQINSHNINVLRQIDTLEQKADKTPEDLEKIESLKESIYDFKIDSFNNTTVIQGLINNATAEFNALLVDKSISQEQFDNYRRLKATSNIYQSDFNQMLEKFNVSDWKNLDKKSLNEFIDSITETGLFSEAMAKLSASSTNAEQIVLENLTKLNSEELTEEEFKNIQEVLEPFINTVINTANEGYALVNNEDYADLQEEWDNINTSLTRNIENAKPEILKLHNYALDLLLEQLSSGNADKEVFLEAEKLVNEEITKLGSIVFPDAKNLSYTTLTNLIQNLQQIIDDINSEDKFSGGWDPSYYWHSNTLEEVIGREEGKYLQNPNHKGLFASKEILNFIKNNFDKDTSLGTLQFIFKKSLESFNLNKPMVDRINKFLEMQSKGIILKSNSLYDFIRKFELTLDSNPNSKVNKIFDILEREETNLQSASNITNYLSDNIREQDINQAINHLGIVKAVIKAMSTTTVNFGDPYGFIQSRKNYAEKYNQEDDVLNLKTITSDVATLMAQDVDVLITKLRFLKDLAAFNAGKMINEQELIRTKVENILLDNWKLWITKMNPSFLPIDKIKEILGSSDSTTSKVMKIENAVFDHNVNKKDEALAEFLKHLQNVDPDSFSQIDKEVSVLESWDLAVYLATVLAMRAEDFHIRSFLTIKGEFNKAPFYTQELAARVAKASTVNPLLFSKIYEIKTNSSKQMADFITIILGGAGTGKTSTVFGLDLDNFRQTNENTNIWLVGPADLQKKNLEDAIKNSVGTAKITSTTSNKNELFERLGIKNLVDTINKEVQDIDDDKIEKKYVKLEAGAITLTDEILNNEWIQSEVGDKLENLPNLLLIDEVTHFSSFELYLLNAISKYSYNSDSLNFMKIIAAGDPTQLGYLVKANGEYYSYNIDAVNAIFTPRLWSSVRASNSQKRINDDRYKRVTRELTNIYKESKGIYTQAADKALAYLKTTKDLNTLSYFQDENNLSGDRIVKSLDKELVSILAKIKQRNPSVIIGVLTKDGTLPEEWNQLLSEANIITPSDMSGIKLFKPSEVQGSEVDYFIFDANLITTYDKVRDNVKAFYTFMSRSKSASIIVDSENVLEKFSIANGKKDGYTSIFEPLTTEVISNAKTKRSEALTTLLGSNPEPSKYDNFKWKVGGVKSEEPIDGSRFVTSDPASLEPIKPTGNSKEEIDYENAILEKDFKVMFHSFYNNPGAVINSKTGEIITNDENPPTDLNFSQNITPENSKKVINSWLSLKNFLLNNKNTDSVISTDFNEFMKYAFNDITSSEHINTEIVLTVSRYNKDINNPYKKHGFDEKSTLANGELFVNLSAKLTYGQKTHYVTLATLGKQSKIIEKATSLNIPTDKIIDKFNSLEKLLEDSKSNMISLKLDDLNSFDFITSTRLETVLADTTSKKKKEFNLSSLQDEFPGLKFSEIRFFPPDFQVFKNLLRKYTFGTERFTGVNISEAETEEKLKALWDGTKDANGKIIKAGLKNKPYIVVSSKNDLDGDAVGTTTQASIVMIGSHKRDLNTLISEIEDLLDERKKEVFNNISSGKGSFIGDKISAKTEALLNRSDILDVLIKWGNTKTGNGNETLLDLLFKDIEFSISDTVTGNKTSVFEIFSRFRNNPASITTSGPLPSTERMKKIIEHVKTAIIKYNGDFVKTKEYVIKESHGLTGWHWTFFNIFAYEKIISETSDAEFRELMLKGQIDEKIYEAFNASKGATEMKEILGQLMQAIKGHKFYYSIPIKPAITAGGPIVANSFIGGKNGFSEETYGDKFFIAAAPESARILMNLNSFINAEIMPDVAPATVATPTPAPAPTPAPVITIVPPSVTPTINTTIGSLNVASVEIPYESVVFDTTAPDNKRKIIGSSHIIDVRDRKIIVLSINGMNIPFYLSTGFGGKTTVAAGKWYPIFGIASDGWLNKLSSQTINDYYGSNILKSISEMLDNQIGDIRTDTSIPKVGATSPHIDFINRDLTPIENGLPNTKEEILKNVNKVIKHLESTNINLNSPSSNQALIISAVDAIQDKDIKEALSTVLNSASDSLRNDFPTKISPVLTSQAFTHLDDSGKVRMILEDLGFTMNNGMVNIASIAPALNLDKMADKNLILELKQKINDLLNLCK